MRQEVREKRGEASLLYGLLQEAVPATEQNATQAYSSNHAQGIAGHVWLTRDDPTFPTVTGAKA